MPMIERKILPVRLGWIPINVPGDEGKTRGHSLKVVVFWNEDTNGVILVSESPIKLYIGKR